MVNFSENDVKLQKIVKRFNFYVNSFYLLQHYLPATYNLTSCFSIKLILQISNISEF